MANMFNGDSALTTVNLSGDGSNISSTYRMFYNASGLTELDLSGFTFGNTSNMLEMFRGCSSLQTIGLSVDTSNNTSDCSLSNMFKADTSLVNANVTVTGGKISSLESMFSGCTSLANLNNVSLDTSNSSGVSLKNMFTDCTGFTNLSLDHLKLENVTSFDNMFSRCTNLTDLSFYACTKAGSTNVSFTNMFAESTNLANLTMKGSGEGITSTAYMFKGRTALRTVNMGEFELSSITNLQEMFRDCTGLTSASLNIDTSASASDVSMKMMFYNDKLLTGASVVGDFSKVSSLESMFESCFKLRSINFGDSPDMSNLQTVYKIIGSINNQTDSDGIFDAFAATFKKWNLGDNQIFETRVGTNTRIKLTEATAGSYGYFDNKPVEKDGKVYMVQDKKYFYRYQ
jgi:surface protein